MRLEKATAFLYSLKPRGIRFGLENTRQVLEALGRPQERFVAVHVAGTNGKGSSCAFAEAMLRAEGLKTGLYTSPHLHDFRERFRVGGRTIEKKTVEKAFEVLLERGLDLKPAEVERWVDENQLQEKMRPENWYRERGAASALCSLTFFECTTIMAFWLFAEMGVEAAVVEVGMGGRLDATNVLRPAVAVITPIGLEHTEWLGDTLEKIAGEKAGIIKPGVPVVCAAQPPEALQVIERTARTAGAPFFAYGHEFWAEGDWRSARLLVGKAIGPVRLGLAGPHQVQNAATAVAALHFSNHPRLQISEPAAVRGLEEVFWPARFERFGPAGRIVVDGAHNPHGVKALLEAARDWFGERPITVVFGVLREKDVASMLELLQPLASRLELVTPRDARARPAEELLPLARKPARVRPSVEQAVEELVANNEPFLVCGSLTVAAQARKYLVEKYGLEGHQWET